MPELHRHHHHHEAAPAEPGAAASFAEVEGTEPTSRSDPKPEPRHHHHLFHQDAASEPDADRPAPEGIEPAAAGVFETPATSGPVPNTTSPADDALNVEGETLTADGRALTPDGEEVTLSILGERTRESSTSRKERLARMHEVLKIVRKYDIIHGLTPTQFKSLLEDLGPTFVKAGQILSMRTEMIPPAFCKVLESLRTEAEPMDYETVREVLAGEYRRPLSEIFASIDERLLGSASVAQVHEARLVTGERVAVKVQRPHVRETMAQDIEVLRNLLNRLQPLMRSHQVMDFQGVIDELWDSFTEETDFLVEARNLTAFREANAHVAYVTAPKPYLHLSTSRVLVMEYVDGYTIAHPAEIVAAGYDLDDIGTKLVQNYAKQVLDDGFFHADPHPGNIMIRNRRIVWIDLGMVGRISSYYRQILRNMLAAVATADTAALKEGLLALSETREIGDLDHGGLLADLDEIVATYGSIDLAELDLGKFLNDLIVLAQRYKIELPGAMTMIARGLVTLEGVLDEFIPGISMIKIIEEHLTGELNLRSSAQKELSDLALEGRKAVHGTLQGLSDLGLVTQMLTRGQLKVNMDFSGSADPVDDLSHVADRLTLGVIVAGLLLASAILFQAGAGDGWIWLAIIAIVGYFVAILIALYIVWDIWKRHRSRRRG